VHPSVNFEGWAEGLDFALVLASALAQEFVAGLENPEPDLAQLGLEALGRARCLDFSGRLELVERLAPGVVAVWFVRDEIGDSCVVWSACRRAPVVVAYGMRLVVG